LAGKGAAAIARQRALLDHIHRPAERCRQPTHSTNNPSGIKTYQASVIEAMAATIKLHPHLIDLPTGFSAG